MYSKPHASTVTEYLKHFTKENSYLIRFFTREYTIKYFKYRIPKDLFYLEARVRPVDLEYYIQNKFKFEILERPIT